MWCITNIYMYYYYSYFYVIYIIVFMYVSGVLMVKYDVWFLEIFNTEFSGVKRIMMSKLY